MGDTTEVKYDVRTLRKTQHIADIGRETIGLHHVFGADLSRRGNLCLINDDTVVYVTANAVVFEEITTSKKEYLIGIDDGGVGCVCVHPSRRLFAVGGKGFQPKIYIYNYPEMTIQNVLPAGAERGYAYLTFNKTGTMLSSLSTNPDFMITVWNWKEERIALHSKAFGQDVFCVRFSLDDERRLTTCGTGHIRFWKMAATFTGLKLQGYIGKFGKVELSDIAAFVEFPDGKVISGTEAGSLLLWEGNFIKCRFVQVGGKFCHKGEVTFVELDREERCVITAGLDGFIRWWSFDAIDTAEVDSDNSMDFELVPVAEYQIVGGAGIKTMIDGGLTNKTRSFVILDNKGHIQRVKFPLATPADLPPMPDTPPPGPLLKLSHAVYSMKSHPELIQPDVKVTSDFHAGAITCMDTCPISHYAVTGGVDGTVRCWDYVKRKLVVTRTFVAAVTALRWVPLEINPPGNQVLVGFADGVVRLLTLALDIEGETLLKRQMVFKPHNAPVSDLSFSNSTGILATTGKDGIVFFFNCKELGGPKESWTPLRFITISPGGVKAAVNCERISWNGTDENVLCSCTDGSLRQVEVRGLHDQHETTDGVHSYEAFFSTTEVVTFAPSSVAIAVSPPQDPPPSSAAAGEEGKEEVVPLVPMKSNIAIYSRDRAKPSIFAGSYVAQRTQLVECNPGAELPSVALPMGAYSVDGKDSLKTPTVTSLRYGWSKKFLVIGASDGSVIIRPNSYIETFARVCAHNGTCGGVTMATMSFDDSYLISVGRDGALASHCVRLDHIEETAESLFKDLDAGVYGTSTVKPIPAELAVEPVYLTRVYQDDSHTHLFAARRGHTRAEEVEVLKTVDRPSEEHHDIASNAYSIQDAKLKSEEDAKRVAAEALKNKVRASVVTLQKQFESIVHLNDSIPAEVRLTREEMAVDGDYLKILEAEGKAMVEEVHKECAYEAEKSAVLRSKLKNRLMGGMIVDEMPLYAFTKLYGRKRVLVKSIRTQGIDPAVREILAAVQRLVKQEELEEANQRANDMAKKKAVLAISEMQERISKKEGGAGGVTDSNEGEGEGAGGIRSTSAAARGAMRKDRKQTISVHDKSKPSENDDDERDITAIREAERTMGDFKLKCADDYEVPEDQRVNASKKCRQMALLEESMVTMRLQYNERFTALRDLKRQLVLAIRKDNSRIREIDFELRQTHLSFGEALWEPKLDPDEFPDDMDEITEDELRQFMKDRESTPWAKVNPPKHSIITGTKTVITKDSLTGAYDTKQKTLPGTFKPGSSLEVSVGEKFLSNPAAVDVTPLRDDEPKNYELKDTSLVNFGGAANKISKSHLAKLESTIPILLIASQVKSKKMLFSRPTEEQEAAINQRAQKLRFEREMLLQKMQENIKEFDDALSDLRFDRHAIVSDLKLTELKLIVMYQEYQLLQTFESRDIALQQKQLRCLGEKSEIQATSAENKAKLDGKLEELSQWTEKSQQILAELKTLLPDTNAFADILTKIFKKKIKRKKMGEDGEEDDAEEEEEEDDDEEEEEEVEDSCPPGCDPILHEKILDLREKRLDTEEISADIQKVVDDVKKTIERLKAREKQIMKDTQQCEVEIQQFQLQKQAALNQIEVVVPLRISQLFSFTTSGRLTVPSDQPTALEAAEADPELAADIATLKNVDERKLVDDIDMKSHVLFNKKTLLRLDKRIGELHIECSEARANFQELHKERVRLSKERENKREDIDKWRQRCNELQMLKFGRIIDLDDLEADADRSKEEEAEQIIRDIEGEFAVKMHKLAKEIEDLQSKLSETTKKNTDLLSAVGELTESKLDITRELNSSDNAAPQESQVDEFRELEERKRIATYVEIQARELEALRAELFMLKRKDAYSIMMPSIPLPQPPQTGSMTSQRTPLDMTLPPIAQKK